MPRDALPDFKIDSISTVAQPIIFSQEYLATREKVHKSHEEKIQSLILVEPWKCHIFVGGGKMCVKDKSIFFGAQEKNSLKIHEFYRFEVTYWIMGIYKTWQVRWKFVVWIVSDSFQDTIKTIAYLRLLKILSGMTTIQLAELAHKSSSKPKQKQIFYESTLACYFWIMIFEKICRLEQLY